MNKTVALTVTDGVAHIALDRPEHSNAIDQTMAAALRDAVESLDEPGVRSVLLSGTGARFCVGGDLASIVAAPEPSSYLHQLASIADAATTALREIEKPVVSAVHGSVAGAGLGIMLAADVIIAADNTKFVFAYPSVGLTPDCGVSAALPMAMGLQRSLAFALSGRALSAQEAQTQGLVTEATSEDPLVKAHGVAQAWATGASGALGASRRLLRASAQLNDDEISQQEANTISDRVTKPEALQLLHGYTKNR